MIRKLKRHIGRHITSFSGWSTDRKIIVIESDDWGSIRMPSKEVYNRCLKAGYRVDENAYERYDSLASEEDLVFLFDLLSSYKDHNGNPAVITANVLAANPDFERIRSSHFQEYYYELIPETFKRYPKHSNCFKLWKEGKDKGFFFPQSHGREHLNVSLFMQALKNGDYDVQFGFDQGMPGLFPKHCLGEGNKFVESLRYRDKADKMEKHSIILEGLMLFKSLFGYKSETFIPPNYLWSSDYDDQMFICGVRYYQGRRKMIEPLVEGGVKIHSHKLGDVNEYGQRYLVRNAIFEPTLTDKSENPVEQCLKDISIAFRFNKPAIISSHRLNYIGFIDEKNRDNNLKMLGKLLSRVIKQWPEVEFLNSLQLGNLITSKKQ